MRGINVGYIKNMKMDVNSVLVLVYIKSSNIFIPKNSIIETSQTGLLSDSVIDIIPLEKVIIEDTRNLNLFSEECHKSKFICHSNYLYGQRGLNYDDLVRAATRISQRFDDPRFFNAFYVFLQNSLIVSDDCNNITTDIANITSLFYYTLRNLLLNFIL
uniref:Mce/MlaD domain-containing protein n=1 Tax=Sebdenia flabellata TaxID=42024 RepID=A0A1C9C9V7_9FLOR|nr:hypothetical protein Sebd_086 [Sebdenia flabellata]AOM65173.1 hypothetical protein Sebd_086 [Sebdenia flabellata]